MSKKSVYSCPAYEQIGDEVHWNERKFVGFSDHAGRMALAEILRAPCNPCENDEKTIGPESCPAYEKIKAVLDRGAVTPECLIELPPGPA